MRACVRACVCACFKTCVRCTVCCEIYVLFLFQTKLNVPVPTYFMVKRLMPKVTQSKVLHWVVNYKLYLKLNKTTIFSMSLGLRIKDV